MTVSCITCQQGRLRDPDDAKRNDALQRMAAHGFILCGHEVATFMPFSSSCSRWQEAAPEVTAARVKWATKEGFM